MNDRCFGNGTLMCSTDGKNFKKVGTVKNITKVIPNDATDKLAKSLNNVAKAFCELSISCNFMSKDLKELMKLLGVPKHVFRKVRKGKRIVRVII